MSSISSVSTAVMGYLEPARFSCDGKEILETWVRNMTPEQGQSLQAVLDQLLFDIRDNIDTLDPFKVLANLSEVIPLDKFILNSEQPLEDAKKFIEAAKEAEKGRGESKNILLVILSTILNRLISTIESIVNIVGFADLAKTSSGKGFEALTKLQRVSVLAMVFSALYGVLVSAAATGAISAGAPGLIVGGIFLSLVLLTVLFQYMRPAPVSLPKAENLSKLVREGKIRPIRGDKDALDLAAASIRRHRGNDNIKNCPMFLAKTGMGKTTNAKALVQAIERGDYPDLKDLDFHLLNGADILASKEMFGGENRTWEQLIEAMGSHHKKTWLIIDEGHKLDECLMDQLKTRMSDGSLNVILLTTYEEFIREIYIKNIAFARRFDLIRLEGLTSLDTLKILNDFVLYAAPGMILEQGVLIDLIEKCKDQTQPITSLDILSKCIEHVQKAQKSDANKKFQQVEKRIGLIHSQALLKQGDLKTFFETQNPGDLLNTLDLAGLKKERSRLEVILEIENKVLDQLNKQKNLIMRLRDEQKKLAQGVTSVEGALSLKDEKKVALVVLFEKFEKELVKKIQSEAQAGVRAVIDRTLIDEVMKKMDEDKAAMAEQLQLSVHERNERIERVS